MNQDQIKTKEEAKQDETKDRKEISVEITHFILKLRL